MFHCCESNCCPIFCASVNTVLSKAWCNTGHSPSRQLLHQWAALSQRGAAGGGRTVLVCALAEGEGEGRESSWKRRPTREPHVTECSVCLAQRRACSHRVYLTRSHQPTPRSHIDSGVEPPLDRSQSGPQADNSALWTRPFQDYGTHFSLDFLHGFSIFAALKCEVDILDIFLQVIYFALETWRGLLARNLLPVCQNTPRWT